MSEPAGVVAYVGIGANLGDAQANVRGALATLDRIAATRLTAQSALFRTAPIDAGGDDYVNAVAQLATTLPPEALLQALHDIESAYERARPYVNAPRTLDLDLLLYGDRRIASPALTVPHPRMTARAFVLVPLLQIDPLVVIPGRGPAQDFLAGVAGQRIARIG